MLTHLSTLKNDNHYNRHLQSSWNKYGKETFKLEEIEYTENQYEKEQKYLDHYDENDKWDRLYNVSKDAIATNVGVPRTKEVKRKISIARKKTAENMDEGGSANNNSKLTEEDVIEIRDKYEPYYYTLSQLADEYNVSQSCINHIVQGRHWQHVGESKDTAESR